MLGQGQGRVPLAGGVEQDGGGPDPCFQPGRCPAFGCFGDQLLRKRAGCGLRGGAGQADHRGGQRVAVISGTGGGRPFVLGGDSHVQRRGIVVEGFQGCNKFALRPGQLGRCGQVAADPVRGLQRSHRADQASACILGEGESLVEERGGHVPALPAGQPGSDLPGQAATGRVGETFQRFPPPHIRVIVGPGGAEDA